jgi:aryl-alcohol dehydrogenase-like predicted oxidoreductase
MKYTRLGHTGMWISKLCLGTANFGFGNSEGVHDWGITDEKEAFKIMDFALDAGINFFDTADVYGPIKARGMTEEIIGRWFKTGGKRRERVVLGTKTGRIFEMDPSDGPNNREGQSLYKIRRHIENSLRRLQTEKVELYQMHKPDLETPWDELWEAFEGLVRSGKVDYIGSSNFHAWEVVNANAVAKRRGFTGLVNEQTMYNPLFRWTAEQEMLPMALNQGIGITLFSPLFRGTLGVDLVEPGKHYMTPESEYHLDVQGLRGKILEYSKLCHEIGESPANVTLAWELHHPAINAVIVAPAMVGDLQDLLRSLEITLDETVLHRIDEIFPPQTEENPWPPHGWKKAE